MSAEWTPMVGEWVIYHPHGGWPEDGLVTEVIDSAKVRVRYRGDTTAKATYIRDLTPGRSDS